MGPREILAGVNRPWARWKAADTPYTVGIEEEVMLLEGNDLSLSQRSDMLMDRLSPGISNRVCGETHAGVVELVTGVHPGVSGAVAELAELRGRLALELRPQDVVPAAGGMHPLASAPETRVSGAPRYQMIAEAMRCLALREPTMALHVHVAVPDCADATAVLRRMRESVPLLVALSANSPFSQGRDTGFASMRTVTFDGFPRTGLPRAFGSYGEYVAAIDGLISSGLIPDPTFLWWDVRLQPRLGTVEVRVMDSQSTVEDTAALVALIQALARLEVEEQPCWSPISPEALAENRFIAARDGLDAHLVDPETLKLAPVRTLLSRLVADCRPHAARLGCAPELEYVTRLLAGNGAVRQRTWVGTSRSLASLLSQLGHQFTAPAVPGMPAAAASAAS